MEMSGVGKELFLSYGREPEVVSFVTQLKHDLEKSGFTVWLDTEDIPAGCDWHGAIGTGLDRCRALIAVITKKYISSRYCKSELYTADGDQKLIFPVIFEDVDFSATQKSMGVKYVISGINWTMFRVGVDDYNMSLSRLIQGMKEQGLAGGTEAVDVGNVSVQRQASSGSIVSDFSSVSMTDPVKERVTTPPVEPTTHAVAELRSLAILDERPTMRELQLIKWYKGGQEKHLRIKASTAPYWKNLGTTFGISPAELDGFERQNMLNQEGCCYAVLQRWLENGSQPKDAYAVTWRGLIQALRDTSLREIADELETALCKSSSSSDVTQQCRAPPATHGSKKGKNTPEYRKLLKSSSSLVRQLAAARCAGQLASQLRAKELIPEPVYYTAITPGPGITELTQVQAMIDAMLSKVEGNSGYYSTFISILRAIDSDYAELVEESG